MVQPKQPLKVTVLGGANSPTSGRIWNISRSTITRPDGKPIIIKWGNVAVQLPKVGEVVSTDIQGRAIPSRIVKLLVAHHEGLSDKPPLKAQTVSVGTQTDVTPADIKAMGESPEEVEEVEEESDKEDSKDTSKSSTKSKSKTKK